MFSCCVPTPRGFCSRKPWRERIFRFCRHWFKPQPRCHWSFRRKSPKGEDVTPVGRRGTCMVGSVQGGRLDKLVAQLVPTLLSGDRSFLLTFLGTYMASATTQQVLDLLFLSHHIQVSPQYSPADTFLASSRYGCILPYAEEDGGPLHQLRMAMTSILGTWLDQYPEDFHQPPEFPCLKMLLAYLELSMPGSALEHSARLLLAQLEHLEPMEAEGDGPAPEQALETPGDPEPATALVPAAAPQPQQIQTIALIHVQALGEGDMPAPVPEPEPAHVLAVISAQS
ncbi:ral guanine nucleotide dissociation stimulator-like [Sus scrofa]|uniref:ral guanine nucleotide dissociation stimulator-like n=1 Tax=Sus scrofa TaxID=9823 RepID=UPI000A2B4109|nr:ral guanine nucleotide dissociation stimulator-like [Sus scrofa]